MPDEINYGMTAAGTECGQSTLSQIQQPSIVDRLKQRRDSLAKQLQTADDAITALEANPETVKIMDLLGKVGRF